MMSHLRYRILIVEDDEVDIMNIKRAFERARVINSLFFATDGLEALNLLNSGTVTKPLLILLDINMPRMNGIEFLTKIRESEEWRMTPVVMLTSSNAEKDKVESYKLNVSGYVVKPVDFSAFVEALSTISSYWSLCDFPPDKYIKGP